MDTPIYVIADIHGQLDQLETALDLIETDGGAAAQIVFLGDLTDRGDHSRAVITRLMTGQQQGRNWQVLKGNHDRMFYRFATTGDQHDPAIKSGLGWLNPRLGGLTTLASYGIPDTDTLSVDDLANAAWTAVPQDHLDYLANLPLFLEQGPLLCVHAGIRPGVPLAKQVEDDLIWIRDPFLEDDRIHPWLVVHGHTALDRPHHFGNRIDLDGGAGYGRPLFPAVFEGTTCWLLTGNGRVLLEPGKPFI